MNRDGKRRLKKAEKYAGELLYQKPSTRMLVDNLYDVVVRGATENVAGAGRLLCRTLLLLSVVDFTLTTTGSTPLPPINIGIFPTI